MEFNSLKDADNAALAALQSATAPQAAQAAPQTPAQPAPEQQPVATPQAPTGRLAQVQPDANAQQQQAAQAAAVAALDDDSTYDVNGEKLTGREIKSGYMRTADYTRKTQEVAAVRKFGEALAQAVGTTDPNQILGYAQALPQLDAFFKNPELMTKYIVDHFGADALRGVAQPQASTPPAEPAANPAVPPSQPQADPARQLEQKLAQTLLAQQQALNKTLEERFAQARFEQERAAYVPQVNAAVEAAMNAHPVLKAVPEMEQVIRAAVRDRNPQTVDEARGMFMEEATKRAQAIQSTWQEQAKQQVAQAQTLASRGTEPPGGVGPTGHQPVNFTKSDGRVDWKALDRAALARIQGMQ